jgi:hypothetical protein
MSWANNSLQTLLTPAKTASKLAQIAKFDGRYLNMPELLSKWVVRVE